MELIKGKIYRDTEKKYQISTYLKFVGYEGDRHTLFEHAGGSDTYIKSDDGCISFSRNVIFYEPTPEELENL